MLRMLAPVVRMARRGCAKSSDRAKVFKGMINASPRDDPVFFSPTTQIMMEGEKYPFAYRRPEDGTTHRIDDLITKYYLSGLFWGYIFYRFYYDWMEVLGEPEWALPRLESFTDEELGIPHDDSLPPRVY